MKTRRFSRLVVNALLKYKDAEFSVFPLSKNSKVPLKESHGYKDATKSRDEIENLWDRNPDANVGISTGSASGLVVIDVDVKNGIDGIGSFEGLCQEYGVPITRTARTPFEDFTIILRCQMM